MYDMRLDPEGNLLPGKSWNDPPGPPPAETELMLSILDMPVTIDRCFVEICGDMAAAAVLTEFSTIENETGRRDQWLPVTSRELEHRLALSDRQQRAACRVLRAKGLVGHRRTGAARTDEYRVLWPAIMTLLRQKATERTAHIAWPPRRPEGVQP
ncbi:hypothetical protein F3J20_11825 [Paraburkholderia sp. Cy-641]|uniref:hypothetical protein n=1 Tax=Paraburkholderia sp. Cy-641 TaxID=2608337 RepID=UPI0014230C8A|nr:hypothetical protein [Paraburkholderia sp. Cy-641]NIF78077.1 hypothetical protein [Paraburkholderia sp. Cy-641]